MYRHLYLGDNLESLSQLPMGSVDLITTDPPFNSKKNWNSIYREKTGKTVRESVMAFNDTWRWYDEAFEDEPSSFDLLEQLRMMECGSKPSEVVAHMLSLYGKSSLTAYALFMAPRLLEFRRCLKETGSIYIHCDYVTSHSTRMLMDSVFGPNCFRNEITWERDKGPKGSQHDVRNYGSSTDSILFYTKSDVYTFNYDDIMVEMTDVEIREKYNRSDDKGRYMCSPITRGNAKGHRPNLVYEYGGYTPGPGGWSMKREKLEAFDNAGDLGWTSNGEPYKKLRPESNKGKHVTNCWTDIARLGSHSAERFGYPTQKPVSLLERIITASSNPGDVVCDPFCGSGTSIVAADGLNREYIGMDKNPDAKEIVLKRLPSTVIAGGIFKRGEQIPKNISDLRALISRDITGAFWQEYAIKAIGGKVNPKRSNDGGVDGWITLSEDQTINGFVQVKTTATRDNVSMLIYNIDHSPDYDFGIMITRKSVSGAMKQMGLDEGTVPTTYGKIDKIQFLDIDDVFRKDLDFGYVLTPKYDILSFFDVAGDEV